MGCAGLCVAVRPLHPVCTQGAIRSTLPCVLVQMGCASRIQPQPAQFFFVAMHGRPCRLLVFIGGCRSEVFHKLYLRVTVTIHVGAVHAGME